MPRQGENWKSMPITITSIIIIYFVGFLFILEPKAPLTIICIAFFLSINFTYWTFKLMKSKIKR